MSAMSFQSSGKVSFGGFTLIEVIISIAIIIVVGGVIVAFQQSVLRNTKVLQSGLTSEQQVRKTLQSFVSEVRAATLSAGGAYPIESAGTSSFIFFSDIDNDNVVERVRYFLSTTSPSMILKKGILKPTGTTYNLAGETVTNIVYDVKNSTSSPVFTYYDTNYDGTTPPLSEPIAIPAVRLVKITLSVDPNAGRSPVFQTYTTQVSIRNLKDNL